MTLQDRNATRGFEAKQRTLPITVQPSTHLRDKQINKGAVVSSRPLSAVNLRRTSKMLPEIPGGVELAPETIDFLYLIVIVAYVHIFICVLLDYSQTGWFNDIRYVWRIQSSCISAYGGCVGLCASTTVCEWWLGVNDIVVLYGCVFDCVMFQLPLSKALWSHV